MTIEDLRKSISIKKQISELYKNTDGFVGIQDWGIHLTARGFLSLFPDSEYEFVEHLHSFPKVYEVATICDGERVFCLVDEITKTQIEGDMA
jgi:hypothetical protein